jgi:hypothetical protein
LTKKQFKRKFFNMDANNKQQWCDPELDAQKSMQNAISDASERDIQRNVKVGDDWKVFPGATTDQVRKPAGDDRH